MKKKLISLLCVASLLIGLLAGCGSSGSAQTANGAKPAADKSASGTIQVGIVLPRMSPDGCRIRHSLSPS